MERFLEVHGTLINVKDIRRVEFISDDIYLGLLPKVNGEVIVDCIDFTYAKIHTFDNREVNLELDLYAPDEGESEAAWRMKNIAYISMSMMQIYDNLKPVKVTEMDEQ